MSDSVSEAALRGPEQDLLGFAGHAAELAGFLTRVDLPFTLGVYGSWGAGKTSFCNMLVHELRSRPGWEKLERIDFTAWPYVTADLVWQAMVECIARKLCDCPRPVSAEPDPPGEPATWRHRLRDTLTSPALTLRSQPVDPAHQRYERLVKRLAVAAGIAARTASERTAGPDAAALIRVAAEAAAAVTPSAGPLQQLLGLGRSAEDVPPSLVTSIEEVRDELQKMFAEVQDRRFVIFVDDLDRCLPEVALDVLETMKVFLVETLEGKAQCLFLVAADERLVARGLDIRLGAAPDGRSSDEARAYLEKIIQLGIPVPLPAPADAHHLVASWAPGWAPASDLITEALDGNPRRIKQQSAVLSYRFATQRSPGSDLSGRERGALHKLFRLHAMAPETFGAVRDMAARTRRLRARLIRYESGPAAPEREDVRAVLQQEPLLSSLRPRTLQALLAIADVRPDADGIPVCGDPALPFVVRKLLRESSTTTVTTLSVSYLSRLLHLRGRSAALIAELARLAGRGSAAYTSAVRALDGWLDATAEDPQARVPADARTLTDLCRPLLALPDAHELLFAVPRLSEIPADFAGPALFKTLRRDPAQAADPELQQILVSASGLVGDAYDIVQRSDAAKSSGTWLRIQVAKEMIERRRFTKSELLFLRWPEIAAWARGSDSGSRLRDLEARVIGNDAEVHLPDHLDAVLSDERLRAFLAMPPALRHGRETVVKAPVPSAVVPTPAGESYETLKLTLETVKPAPNGDVTARITLGDIEPVVLDVPVRRIEEMLARVPFNRITRDIAPRLSGSEVIAEIGSLLWNSTLGRAPELAGRIMSALAGPGRTRIAVGSPDLELAGLPWECLYLPSHRRFAGQTLKLSIVRDTADVKRLAEPRLATPVRILLVAASPAGLPLPGAEQETPIVRLALEGVVRQGLARVEELRDARRSTLQEAVRSFAPHILHFVGHGVVRDGKGYVVLLDDNGDPDSMAAEDFGTILQDHGIGLAVLNGCHTGSSAIRDVAAGVAQVLVRQGVPAVVATTRDVLDTTALSFTGEFYRALAGGYPAEAALVEARKALALAEADWSSYVLHADLRFPLAELRIPVARAEP